MMESLVEARSQLRRLVGIWDGAGKVHPNPFGPDGPTSGRWTFRMDPDDISLIGDYAEERPGGHRFHGHGVLTIDPERLDAIWFWFDTYGFPPIAPARGRWEGDQLILEKTTPRGVGRTLFRVDGDRLQHEASARLAGEETFRQISSMTLARISAAG
ncbi:MULTISPECIES: DUF1579 family protein [Caulobacter]|jgi:hypothetical protein|uniref:DUF1579 family protein n=1 Tax=Caulobacter TaxID=75 RepID=UPI0006FBE041|nr:MULTISPECIES: DUF1579 family protein [Caulobacter]KQZ30098.1 hypothetical protein ASD47_04870 [Caulobacter sp. Root1472]